MNNIYASIFGESPATKQARAQRDSAFQSMLDTRKKAIEEQRTSDVQMARYNAFGNLLTSMVQPLGWGIGGRGKTTGGVEPYDQRQYLDAFNRAVRDAENLRNIGTQEGEYQFKLADEEYRRALANDQAYRNAMLSEITDNRRAQQKLDYEARRQEDELEKIAARGDVQKELADLKAKYRITRGGLSVNDRALITARNNYEQYKRTRVIQGQPYMTFEQYMNNEEGFDLAPAPVQSPAPKPAAKPAAKTQAQAQTPAKTTQSGGNHVSFKFGKGAKTASTTNKNDKSSVTLE